MSKFVDSAFDGCLLLRGPRRGKPHSLHLRHCDINNLSLNSSKSSGQILPPVEQSAPLELNDTISSNKERTFSIFY